MHDEKVLQTTIKMIRTLGRSLGQLPPYARERIRLLHDRATAHFQDKKPLTIAAADVDTMTLALTTLSSLIDMQGSLEFLEPPDEPPKHDGRRT